MNIVLYNIFDTYYSFVMLSYHYLVTELLRHPVYDII